MAEQFTSPAPTQNDKIMAALAHVSALLPLMGVIAPIVIWATQKDKVGAIMTFQGKNFRYIIIGQQLANYLQKSN